MFVDTHAHLSNERLKNNLKEVIDYAKDMGVEKIICSGSDMLSSRESVAIASQFDNVYATIGVHPQDVEDFNQSTLYELCELAKNKKVVGIGEIGLEYMEGRPDKEKQKDAFRSQIRLAQELNVPIVIHSREAISDTISVLKEFKNIKGTLHCFSESLESAKIILNLGLHISIGGVVTFKNGRKLQEVVPELPIDRILLETDCPYLAPEPNRGKLNQSAYIPLIAEKIASLKGLSVSEIATATTNNARRLFNL